MSRSKSLFFVLLAFFAVPPAAWCDGEPADALRAVRSRLGAWSVKVPSSWKSEASPDDANYTDAMRFAGAPPAALLLQIQVARLDAPMHVLEMSVRQALARQGERPRNETRPTLHGMPAWRFERQQNENGMHLRVVQTIVDGGTRKIVLTAFADDPLSAPVRDALDAVLASLEIAPVEPLPALEFAKRDLAEGGLTIELPRGGVTAAVENGLQISWPERGLLFKAEWHRTTAGLGTGIELDFDTHDPEADEGVTSSIIDDDPVPFSDGKGRRIHVYGQYGERRIMSLALVYRASGPEEIVSYGFARFGEIAFTELAGLEALLAKAEVAPHFRAPATALPGLAITAQGWGGRGSFQVPKGWATGVASWPPGGQGAPMVEERKRWHEPRSPDLGITVETGRIKGGKATFEEWLHTGLYKRRHAPVPTSPRPLSVGGRAGFVWDVEHGATTDRWITTVVAVFDGTRYDLILSECPARLKDVYGSLAVKIAATVEWKK